MSAILIGLGSVLATQFSKRSALAKTLRERERGYRLLAENVEDVVIRFDRAGRRLYISPSVEKLFGWTRRPLPCAMLALESVCY